MKPLELNKESCDPISSNCVTWGGPSLPCIDLCKGDTITDVVYKLAVELCELKDLLDLDNYDITCLSLPCPSPKDFSELIQILINRICALEDCCDQQVQAAAEGCPDCVVNIAECFWFTNEVGDIVTTMQLDDYVIAIGNRICSQSTQLGGNQTTLENHEERITTLEEEPEPSFVLPTMNPVCVMTGSNIPIDEVLIELERQFCELRGATGEPTDIYIAISNQCAGLDDAEKLGPGGGNMSSIPGWKTTVQNISDSFTNMWLTICDIRAAVQNIKINCCPTGCDGVTVNLQASMSSPTTLVLYFTGTIPAGFQQCDPSGTQVTVMDTLGGSIVTTINLFAVINDPGGFPIDISGTPLNSSSDFTITSIICLENLSEGTECQFQLTATVINTFTCPNVSYSSTQTEISYDITHIASGTVTYTVEVYNNAGTVLIASQATTVSSPQTILGTFTGLASSTAYKVRVRATVGTKTTNCPFTPVTTLSEACNPPTNVTAELNIP